MAHIQEDILDNLPPSDRPRPGYHFDFLALPPEVRNIIYGFTLNTDPPRLDREHNYDCFYCTWDPNLPQDSMVDYYERTRTGCRCWARRGLALLLANRQINEEAASMFWAQNHFSFRGADSFIRLVGNGLRPQYRQMISHVTIHTDTWGRDNLKPPPTEFWDTIFQCKGLQTLELPPYEPSIRKCILVDEFPRLVEVECIPWDHLRSELPGLRTLSWAYFQPNYAGLLCGFEYPRRIGKCLDIKALSPEQLRRCREFTLDEQWFASSLFETVFPRGPRYPVADDLVVSTGKAHEFYYRGTSEIRTIGDNKTPGVTRTEYIPTTWTVKYYQVPLSPETIARNFMLRRRDQDSKKAWKYLEGLTIGGSKLLRDLSGLGRPSGMGISRLGFR